MRIFKINENSNDIQLIQPNDHSKITLERYRFECESRKANWEDLLYYVYNPLIKPKNFYSFASGTLAFDEKVLELCRTIFEMSGEIFPIQIERGPVIYVLNILECMNGLDYENTTWDYYNDGTKGRILKYAFHQERVINEATLFKIPETAKIDIFCFADTKDKQDEFYHIYHDNNLTGLTFEEIK